MAFLLGVIFLGLYFWLCWYLAEQVYEAAQAKGFPDKKYFWITFWLGLAGYLLVIALPDRGDSISYGGSMPAVEQIPQGRSNLSAFYDDLPDL